jgi:beta-aspartyl-peptidase (threonine type)
MRAVAAYHIASAIEYRGLTVEEAVGEMLTSVLPQPGGRGGIIAIDARGRFTMQFNTDGMFRGARTSQGDRSVAIRR